mmetsp:Transcript_17637/g.35581  ORF Transcript_17637/g.35581 Transcript_17637/m.35581 type:complete len:328 (+) Transcript_17637:2486-3469(+)
MFLPFLKQGHFQETQEIVRVRRANAPARSSLQLKLVGSGVRFELSRTHRGLGRWVDHAELFRDTVHRGDLLLIRADIEQLTTQRRGHKAKWLRTCLRGLLHDFDLEFIDLKSKKAVRVLGHELVPESLELLGDLFRGRIPLGKDVDEDASRNGSSNLRVEHGSLSFVHALDENLLRAILSVECWFVGHGTNKQRLWASPPSWFGVFVGSKVDLRIGLGDRKPLKVEVIGHTIELEDMGDGRAHVTSERIFFKLVAVHEVQIARLAALLVEHEHNVANTPLLQLRSVVCHGSFSSFDQARQSVVFDIRTVIEGDVHGVEGFCILGTER